MNLIAKIKTLWLRIKESLTRKKRETKVPFNIIRQEVFSNVIFKDPFGNPNLTHEIDRIIVRKNGIFCIENKNWQGVIYGFEDDGPWRQKIFHQFHSRPSPIVQNEAHKDVLEEILDGNQQDYVIPVVVMLENNCPIKNGKFCTNEKDLEKFMENHTSFQPELTDEEFEEVCKIIHENDCSSVISRSQHIENIYKSHELDYKLA